MAYLKSAVSAGWATRYAEIRWQTRSRHDRLTVRAAIATVAPTLRSQGIVRMGLPKLRSSLCQQAMLETPAFANCLTKLVPDKMQPDGSAPLHRKFWEWAFIAEALAERGCLQAGKRGLGFAVGTEALPAYFAGIGCDILATDCPTDDVQNLQFWSTTNQHAQSTADLLRPDLCPNDLFAQRVKFRPVDMKSLPSDLRGFDFCWSACAFEHLGSLPLGMDFVEASLDCLKPGGIAIHTTEFNVLSNTFTPDVGPYVIYRRCDIEGLVERLRANGHAIDIDYATGDGRWDHEIDYPPYQWKHHLKLLLAGYVTTSLGLIIAKGANPRGVHKARVRVLRSKMATVLRRPFLALKRRLA